MFILRKNRLSYFIIIVVLVALAVLTITNEDYQKYDMSIIMSLTINGFIWLRLLIKEIKKNAYSLKIMNWFFCLFFFSLAPMVQYYGSYFPWIGFRSDAILLRANKLLIVWTAALILGIKIGQCRNMVKIKHSKTILGKWIGWKGYERLIPFLTGINTINTSIRILTVGAANLLSRSTNTGVRFSNYGSLSRLISVFIEGTVYFTVAISIIQYKYHKRNKKNWGILGFNSILLVISYFPTGLARYAMAVIYLGLMIIFFEKLKNNRFFILLFTMAFTVIMPFMNAFRTVEFADVNIIKSFSDSFNNIISGWKAVDYDAYTYFTLTLEYVDRHGTGGHHLLSDLFFWVPRRIWPSKALSGSYEIAHELGLFDNVSFPFPSIGYMDGGIIGMVLFGIAIGLIMELVDGFYWNCVDVNNRIVHCFDILYPVIVIFWFFLYRGDIFYTLIYLVGYILAWYSIRWFTKKISKVSW